ncbi:IclR family transcriptional regulator [Paucibacter sp. R3-3]|uniref:IclR family transcriptional regulator n=1 Tax=Roseateles agri TaxID=3098619 RepID=A0ABU5DQS5_9BURK|nr:IclR family transcriptional regulator [Paucibacter sp. R3-3]MDY0748083.1 IclR family transcriptional regulator [Paucibacter sp. R3-3]
MIEDTNNNEDSADRYNVPALERGLRILAEFNRHTQVVSPPELARRLELPRSTVFRLLTTLENMGFVQRSEGGNDYRLGLAVLRLGFEYLASLPLNELGQPLLRRLSEEIAYPCNIVVRDWRSIVYVTRVSPQAPASPFVGAVNVGTRLPAHGTVLGRMVLADLSLAQLRALYPEDNLESFSVDTPRTVSALYELLQLDLRRGCAIGEGFFEPNISTIAAPVRDHSGHIVAALGVTINAGRFQDVQLDESRVDAMVASVKRTAAELSRLLNYSPRPAVAE